VRCSIVTSQCHDVYDLRVVGHDVVLCEVNL